MNVHGFGLERKAMDRALRMRMIMTTSEFQDCLSFQSIGSTEC